ncbi:MAG: M48 family metallopeptidase [Oscillospiraceae bacterium]|nr:M48 family metallopeptidase [Oscillospiraceae bacterium]MDE6998385.1 M48 family metallopeptidase [Oscillospiraceae bacterium]
MSLEITRDCRVVVRAPLRMPEKQIDAFVSGHADWITAHMAIQQKRREDHPEPTPEERAEYIRRAREELPVRVAKYSRIMGLYPAGITITGAEKRFGSCSGKNRICFSWRLMGYPEAAIDYVVVHELAHIRHKDHSKAFYACVEEVLPDWRERRRLLKE